MFLSPLRRKSIKLSSREVVHSENQENLDQNSPRKRERRNSVFGSLFRATHPHHEEHLNEDPSSPPPPRPFSPKVHNYNRYARGMHSFLEAVDQNTTDSHMEYLTCPDIENLQEISGEDSEDEIVPVPFVDEEEALHLLLRPSSSSHVIVDSEPREDSRLTLEMKSGSYYEVWDPRSSDQFSMVGRVKHHPLLPSRTSAHYSQLIWLSIEVYMQCPRKPSQGHTEVKYLKLVENRTVLEPKIEDLASTVEKRHPDNPTNKTNQEQQALSPILGFLSPRSTLDLQVKPIVWYQGAQVCMFKLTLPVADPFLFLDNGAGEVVRTMKIRSRGVIQVIANGTVTVTESIVEQNVVVDVLKNTVFMDG